jgi:hypothetical protein
MFRLQIHSRYDLVRGGENKSLRKKEEKLWNIPFYFNILFQNIIVPLETFGWCSEKRKSLHEATAAKHPPVKSATTWQADNVCIARQLQLPPVLSAISSGGCMGAFGPFAADLPASAPCLPLFFLSLSLSLSPSAVRFCACEGTVVAAPAQCWICFDLTR